MKKILIIVATVLLFSACSKVSDETILQARDAVAKGALIVDVRTPKEFAQNHLDNAINIPLKELKARVKSMDKSKPIVVYCQSGSRAGYAKEFLDKQGFKVYNVATQEDFKRKISIEH